MSTTLEWEKGKIGNDWYLAERDARGNLIQDVACINTKKRTFDIDAGPDQSYPPGATLDEVKAYVLVLYKMRE